jgi:salicylate hydroxylase
VASPKTILIAGAGIGGLTSALALARAGFRVVVFEAAAELSDVGAGIQLSPNATRVLTALGLGDALRPHAVAPQSVRVMDARTGREIVRIPLGAEVETRYRSPYWVVHRADLQRVLSEAVAAQPEIVLRLGFTVRDFAVRPEGGVTVAGKTRSGVLMSEQGDALIGADGLRSVLRARLGYEAEPRFQRRAAWRALVDAAAMDPAWRTPDVHLWLGADAHLVHYPVRASQAINLVAIADDATPAQGWAAPTSRETVLTKFARWAEPARTVLGVPADWQKWSLFDLPPTPRRGRGPVTLLGDAAHAMLPYLAQGGAMAIEGAAALAARVGDTDDLAAAFRTYEDDRADRVVRAAQESQRIGRVYHLGGPLALARNLVMRHTGGQRLGVRQDWLYRWTL